MNQDTQNFGQNISAITPQSQALNFWSTWLEHEGVQLNKCRQFMNHNQMKAEDALSGARKKAWTAWPKVAKDLKNPKAWLSTVTRNHCRDLHRSAKRHAIATDELENYDVVSITALSPAKTPFQKLLKDELYQVLQTEIQQLPDELREPFLDYYLREKTTQDISQRLGISEASVYKRNQKTRERLRHRLNLYLHSDRYRQNLSPESIESLTFNVDRPYTSRTHSYRISVPCQTMQPQLWSQFSIQLGCR